MDKDMIIKNMVKRENERQFEIQKKKNEMKLIHPEHEQYHYFTEVFQDKLKQINVWLDASNTLQQNELIFHFDQIWKELHLLQKFVADSLLFLREYDIRICQKSLLDAEVKTRKLEENLLPKKKFGFKNKRTAQVKKCTNDETDSKRRQDFNIINEHFYGFRNESNSTLILEDEHLFKRDISLQNLDKCLVRLNGAPSTLHMSNLRGCVVLCGPVSTSVFVENCTDCKFAIACQQLRLHSSRNCDIYLHVTSKAIIEDSGEIKLAEYNYNYGRLSEDYEKSTLDKNVNNWSNVEDFNWLVLDKQSPNWGLLESNKQINNWDNIEL